MKYFRLNYQETKMKINIIRFQNEKSYKQEYELKFEKFHNRLLDAFVEIKTKIDPTFTFRSGCKSGVCGSCAVKVNGVEKLACKCVANDGDMVEPISKHTMIRDLVCNYDKALSKLEKIEPNIKSKNDVDIFKKDEKRIDRQSDCILCQSCYSSCPVLDYNADFLGPYALTKSYRYIEDKKESNTNSKIEAIQKNGIWDCTLCGNCTIVCPQGIDPKQDISELRNISVINGFSNPNQSFANFNQDFGFNPNNF